MKFIKQKHLGGVITFSVLILIWCILTYGGIVKALFLPSPTKVLQSLFELLQSGSYFSEVYVSVRRVVIGFITASIVAVPLGMIMGTYESVRIFFEPLISFVRYMPATAFIPLFIMILGIGEIEKIAVIIFGSFFYLTMMVMDTTKNVDQDLIEISQTMGASKKVIFKSVIFPAAYPGIVDALRTTFGSAWTYLVVAEITGASQGLGYMIMSASRFLKSPQMYVGILTIGLLGLLFDILFRIYQNKRFGYLKKGAD